MQLVPSDSSNKATSKTVAIQLWDTGGGGQNISNRMGWNAMLYNADGIIFVYNADRPGQEKDLETLLYWFHQRPHSAVLKPIPETRILVLAHHHKSMARSRFATVSALPPEFAEKSKGREFSLKESKWRYNVSPIHCFQ